MSDTAQQAYDAIIAHIKKQGGDLSSWYAGITENASTRLFNDHNVSKDNGWWIYRNCTSSTAARNVEKQLLNDGCNGGTGGGDNDATYVYAYLKTYVTNP